MMLSVAERVICQSLTLRQPDHRYGGGATKWGHNSQNDLRENPKLDIFALGFYCEDVLYGNGMKMYRRHEYNKREVVLAPRCG